MSSYLRRCKFDPRILSKTTDIIYHTGLLKNEIVALTVGDVEKNGSIVPSIQPVAGYYPHGFRRDPVIVSKTAGRVLQEHIRYLRIHKQDVSRSDPFVVKDLFPSDLLFPLGRADDKLWAALSKYSQYSGYERHRQAGILKMCWQKQRQGLSKDRIIKEVHELTRYLNLARTEKLVKEGISRDMDKYEEDYRNTINAAHKLIASHKTRPDRIPKYLSELQNNLPLLSPRDKKTVLTQLNKSLLPSKIKIVEQDNLFQIQEITGTVIKLKRIKRRILN